MLSALRTTALVAVSLVTIVYSQGTTNEPSVEFADYIASHPFAVTRDILTGDDRYGIPKFSKDSEVRSPANLLFGSMRRNTMVLPFDTTLTDPDSAFVNVQRNRMLLAAVALFDSTVADDATALLRACPPKFTESNPIGAIGPLTLWIDSHKHNTLVPYIQFLKAAYFAQILKDLPAQNARVAEYKATLATLCTALGESKIPLLKVMGEYLMEPSAFEPVK